MNPQGVQREVESFATAMIQSFFESHIETGILYKPKEIYDTYLHLTDSSVLKVLQKKTRKNIYLKNTLHDLALDAAILSGRGNKLNKIAQERGSRSYVELRSQTRYVSPAHWRAHTKEFLVKTEKVYKELFQQVHGDTWGKITPTKGLRTVKEKLALKKAKSTQEVLKTFLPSSVYAKVNKKIQWNEHFNIPFLAPFKIPSKIAYVAPRRCESYMDIAGALHEAGHAFGFMTTSPHLDSVFKRLGPSDLTESYAFLFQHLLEESALPSRVRQTLQWYRLYNLRRACVRYRALGLIHGNKKTSSNQLKKDIKNDLGYKLPEEELYDYLDDNFTGVEIMKAGIFHAHLVHAFKKTYGEKWYTCQQTWDKVTERMKQGNKWTTSEQSKNLGYTPFTLQPVIQECTP